MSEEKTISIGSLAIELGKDTKTIRQMCETGQIPESAYYIVDKGTAWEMPVFYKAKVFKALKPKAKEKIEPAKDVSKKTKK